MSDTGRATLREVTIDVFIAARPSTVWEYWVDPARMCEWWGIEADLEPQPGGLFRIVMGAGQIMRGEYVELVPHERLVFLFGWERGGDPAVPPRSTRVEVTLTDEHNGTRLTLRHAEVPAESASAHRDGWMHFLGVLRDTAGATS